MTVQREGCPVARLAAMTAAGFRVVVLAGCISLISLSTVLAENEGNGRSESSQGNSGSSDDRGDKGSQGKESQGESSRSGSVPDSSDDERDSRSGSSRGNSASSSGNSSAARANAPGQNRGFGSASRSDSSDSRPPGLDQSDVLDAVRDDKIFSLKQLLPRVTDRYNGKVIDVALWPEDERLVYSFKLRMENGTVRTIRMDAHTGRFLGFAAFLR
jgi:uncharacterized membrane protein YkoI